MPMEIIQHKNYKEAKLAFLLYQRLWSARAISFVILVMLPIFEVCRTFGYLWNVYILLCEFQTNSLFGYEYDWFEIVLRGEP
jgi:hypothetical protein